MWSTVSEFGLRFLRIRKLIQWRNGNMWAWLTQTSVDTGLSNRSGTIHLPWNEVNFTDIGTREERDFKRDTGIEIWSRINITIVGCCTGNSLLTSLTTLRTGLLTQFRVSNEYSGTCSIHVHPSSMAPLENSYFFLFHLLIATKIADFDFFPETGMSKIGRQKSGPPREQFLTLIYSP